MKSWMPLLLGGATFSVTASARSVVVEHAFGPEAKFAVRGSIDLVVDPSREVPATASSLPARLEVADATQLKARKDQVFHPDQRNLVDDDGLYLIKLATDDSSGNSVIAAVPACHLRLSGFREDITLHVEWGGTIIGLDYKAPVGPLASTRDCKKMPVPESTQITTTIKVVRAASAQSNLRRDHDWRPYGINSQTPHGMVMFTLSSAGIPLQVLTQNPPPGLMHLKENHGSQDPAAVGSQSIIVKYWYIFLPLVITWMFSTGPGPAEQGTSGSGAGGQPGGR